MPAVGLHGVEVGRRAGVQGLLLLRELEGQGGSKEAAGQGGGGAGEPGIGWAVWDVGDDQVGAAAEDLQGRQAPRTGLNRRIWWQAQARVIEGSGALWSDKPLYYGIIILLLPHL